MPAEFRSGDLVLLNNENWAGAVGVVSQPIGELSGGHVLTLQDGNLVGVSVSVEDVRVAGESCEGFAQLAYGLIKLGSHVIEQRLLIYRR